MRIKIINLSIICFTIFAITFPYNAKAVGECSNMMDMGTHQKNHPAHAIGNGTSLDVSGYTLQKIQVPTKQSDKTLSFKINDYNKRTLENYTLDMGKILHLLVYSNDFMVYKHYHPTLNKDGVFSQILDIPFNKTYYFVADVSTPTSDKNNPTAQLVFGDSFNYGAKSKPVALSKPKCNITSNGYTISLSSTKLPLDHSSLMLTITNKKGEPVRFGRFLGVDAHLVVFRESDRRYSHFHPMNMDGSMPKMWGKTISLKDKSLSKFSGEQANDILPANNNSTVGMLHFMTEPPGKGRYIAFLQFVDNNKLITTNFTFEA